MGLDPRVRATLLDFHAGDCDVEAAAQRLLAVRRETGCLELHASSESTALQRALVARVAELMRQEFGG